jgi:hypothetical protein
VTKTIPNRDLVRLWDLQKGEPSDEEIDTSLTALAPVWLAWNSPD